MRNAFTERWFGREVELMQHAEEEAARYAAARRADDMGVAAVIAGEASGLIRDVPSVAVLMERIVREAEDLLAHPSSRLAPDSAKPKRQLAAH